MTRNMILFIYVFSSQSVCLSTITYSVLDKKRWNLLACLLDYFFPQFFVDAYKNTILFCLDS